VKEVHDELVERPEFQKPDGTPIEMPVLMTSDESDPDWWDGVRSKGWTWIDHGPEGEDTSNILGNWYVLGQANSADLVTRPNHIEKNRRYPTLIDAIIQSLGHGFVGTDQSTMSVIAQRRVEDWQHGATRVFLWGRKDADYHLPQLKNERVVPDNRYY
jgi:hypothetical protein